MKGKGHWELHSLKLNEGPEGHEGMKGNGHAGAKGMKA
jgi:hypothetical protein